MKIATTVAVAATLAQNIGAIAAVANPNPNPNPDDGALDAPSSQTDFELAERSTGQEKWKRKGGGGGGGRGGGGSSSSGSGRGSGNCKSHPPQSQSASAAVVRSLTRFRRRFQLWLVRIKRVRIVPARRID